MDKGSDVLPVQMVSVPEVARSLRVHENTVRKMIYRGSVRGVRIGRVWRIPMAEYQRLLGSILGTPE